MAKNIQNTFKTSLLVGYFVLWNKNNNTMLVWDKKAEAAQPKKPLDWYNSFCYAAQNKKFCFKS